MFMNNIGRIRNNIENEYQKYIKYETRICKSNQ